MARPAAGYSRGLLHSLCPAKSTVYKMICCDYSLHEAYSEYSTVIILPWKSSFLVSVETREFELSMYARQFHVYSCFQKRLTRRGTTRNFFVTLFKHWLFLIIIMSWNLRKPLSSQELQEEVENLSEEEFRDFSDFSDIGPDYNNSNSELGSVSSDESNEDPISSDNEEVMENEDDENGTAPDPASKQFEFSWYDYSGNHKTFRFTGNEGIQVDLAKNLTPVAAFDQFFSPELIALIVEETNRYAAYIISTTNVTRKSRLNQWYPTNEQEIRKFVGFYIWMGLNCRPAIASYWSTDVLYKNQVSQVLSRNRFEMLLRMIHFSDRENETNNDRLYKIRPVLDMLNNSFQQPYTVGQEMVIDESMIPWRGRLKFRQYIPTKIHKYGVKLFKLCSPSGYTWKCQIYTGRTEEQRPAGLGIGETVVLALTEGLLDEGRTLYTDNFYTIVH
ncbi:hypothetical protein JTB14_015917 [Gonioctena quinquepunctata]|nr:hypothetical protein JTB14_015917 [Gonioctena quinquepunctata]